MQAPSGKIFTNYEVGLVRTMNRYGTLRYQNEPFTLQSGIKSYIYVGCREDITDHPDLEWMIGMEIAKLVNSHASKEKDSKTQCLIGVPSAGNVLAQAAAMAGAQARNSYRGFCHRIMRAQLKQYGVHTTWVDGKPMPLEHSYWLVDNALTTGGSLLKSMRNLLADGYVTEDVRIFALIDRQHLGMAYLNDAGFNNIVVGYQLTDLVYILTEFREWPKIALKYMEDEIQASIPF